MLPLRLSWNAAEDRWANIIEPVLQLPPNQGLVRKNIKLTTGVNTVNTLLGRPQQGWVLTDQDAASQIYRSAPFNSSTLQLTASAPCTVSIWMF